MNASNSSAPGASTPGGELEQISPGAWPTENGGQTENSAPIASVPQTSLGGPAVAAEIARGDWERIKGNLRRRYGPMTDHDLRYVEGGESALIDRIQKKAVCSRAEVEAILEVRR